MTKIKFLFLASIVLGLTTLSCSKDEEENNPQTCSAPTDLVLDEATQNSITISYISGGSASFTIEYGESGFTQGSGTTVSTADEMYTITGLESNTAYDIYVRGVCSESQSSWINLTGQSTLNPLVGNWNAYDVSPLLAGLGITGITAQFNENNTYEVVSTAGSASTTFTGTYEVSESPNAEGIYTIVLNQSEPSSLTSEGIFQVYAASPDSMWYEVAQTNPAIVGVTPPTADAGFGSTSGGAFGTTNIQKYNRQ
jgi:hypothetical protein